MYAKISIASYIILVFTSAAWSFQPALLEATPIASLSTKLIASLQDDGYLFDVVLCMLGMGMVMVVEV